MAKYMECTNSYSLITKNTTKYPLLKYKSYVKTYYLQLLFAVDYTYYRVER